MCRNIKIVKTFSLSFVFFIFPHKRELKKLWKFVLLFSFNNHYNDDVNNHVNNGNYNNSTIIKYFSFTYFLFDGQVDNVGTCHCSCERTFFNERIFFFFQENIQ